MEPNSSRFRSHTPASDFSSGSSSSNLMEISWDLMEIEWDFMMIYGIFLSDCSWDLNLQTWYFIVIFHGIWWLKKPRNHPLQDSMGFGPWIYEVWNLEKPPLGMAGTGWIWWLVPSMNAGAYRIKHTKLVKDECNREYHRFIFLCKKKNGGNR